MWSPWSHYNSMLHSSLHGMDFVSMLDDESQEDLRSNKNLVVDKGALLKLLS